jgi:hypothetical protein
MQVRLIQFLILVLLISAAHAGTVLQVTLDTGAGSFVNPPGPFSLAFELTDGSGTRDGNNIVTMSNFQFGLGGGVVGAPFTSGSASGDLSTSVALTDAQFDNIFFQGFTPGTILQFDLSLTTNVDPGGIPDEFIMSILDSSFSPLPTTSFSPLLPFLVIDIDSSNPTVQTFGSDPNQQPAAGGFPPPFLPAPVVTSISPNPGSTSISPVPEPSTGWICGISLACLIALRVSAKLT